MSNIGTWMESIALGIYVTEAHAPGRVDRHGRGRRVPADRVLQPDRRRARRPVPAPAAADRHEPGPDRRWRRCSPCCSSSATRRRRSSRSSRSATASCAALGFPSFQAMLPDLVPVEDLPGAIALSSAQYNLGRVDRARDRRHRDRDRRLRVGRGHQRGELPRRRRGDAHAHAARRPRRGARARSSSRSIADGFRFVRREPGLRDHRARDVPQHVPRRAVHRARARDGDRGAATAATVGTAVLVTAQGIGAVLMAFSLGSLVERYGPRRVLVTLMAHAAVRARRLRRRARPRALGASRCSSSACSTSARSRASRRSRSCACPPRSAAACSRCSP